MSCATHSSPPVLEYIRRSETIDAPLDIHITIAHERKEKSTCHEIRNDNVVWSVRIYIGPPIEKIRGDLVVVEDD